MIAAESAATSRSITHAATHTNALLRIVARLRLLLAAPRSEGSDDHAYWQAIARGL